MQTYPIVPHQGRTGVPVGAPNAALLIDFDNVTMGIRSDLTRQLKDLLNSDIIKGKVAVQRAYADWRRYAQYIVPLSEASVDLIFAPAYGSSKKNATDIRLAIDALELVFTRPEIGVFILLSGDSDFSSLVLKLKEYGKYVIGVGLRESASDLLVQNCDEYFSYSALTGLKKAGEDDVISASDPWDLAERAVSQMAQQNDVMRSDRLKQVMIELDPSFDESQLGYSKFNRFLVEAASRNKLGLKKLDNGQYEVQPLTNGQDGLPEEPRRERGRGRRDKRDSRGRDEARMQTRKEAQSPRAEASRQPERSEEPARPAPRPSTRERRTDDLDRAYALLRQAVQQLVERGDGAARDSDIKRQMLELQEGWDESELGFTKFSRFLRQAHDAEVIDLQRSGEGYYQAVLPRGSAPRSEQPPEDAPRARERERDRDRDRDRGRGRDRDRSRGRERPEADRPARQEQQQERVAAEAVTEAAAAPEPHVEAEAEPDVREGETPEPEQKAEAPSGPAQPAARQAPARTMGRGRGGRRGAAEGPPPLLPGQVVGGAGPGNGAVGGRGAERPAEEPVVAHQEPPVEAVSEPDAAPEEKAEPRAQPAPGSGPEFDAEELGLPTDAPAVIRYLSNSYQGVGQKTAETLITTFGADRVFNGLQSQPERVREVLGTGRRTDVLLETWERDYRRRTTAGAAATADSGTGSTSG